MAEPRITIIINGTTYSLCADNAEAIGHMPLVDRQHLITLLDVVRSRTDPAQVPAPRPSPAAAIAAPGKPATPVGAAPVTAREATPERMGSGDIDALMARLAAEDSQRRKPALTRAAIYKVTGGFLLLILLLVVML